MRAVLFRSDVDVTFKSLENRRERVHVKVKNMSYENVVNVSLVEPNAIMKRADNGRIKAVQVDVTKLSSTSETHGNTIGLMIQNVVKFDILMSKTELEEITNQFNKGTNLSTKSSGCFIATKVEQSSTNSNQSELNTHRSIESFNIKRREPNVINVILDNIGFKGVNDITSRMSDGVERANNCVQISRLEAKVATGLRIQQHPEETGREPIGDL